MTVMEMVGILNKASNMAERLLDSGRYDEALEKYGLVLHVCENPQVRGMDEGNGDNENENGGSSRGVEGSTETETKAAVEVVLADGKNCQSRGGR